MLVMKDMSTGDVDYIDEYEEETLSSGWNPAAAEMIHREIDHHEITQAENTIPSDLSDVDVNDFLEKMYSYMD